MSEAFMMVCIELLTDVAPGKYSSSSDTDWTPLALIIGIIILIWTIGSIFSYFSKKRKDRLIDLKALENKLNEDRQQLNLDREAVGQLAKEKATGFPWLAKAYADYFELQDLKSAEYLRRKSHPALKAAEVVKRLASEKRVTEQLYRVLRYQLEYYEKLFPWLIDFKSEDIDDLIIKLTTKKEGGMDIPDEQDDPVKQWVTQAEYESLTNSEKN